MTSSGVSFRSGNSKNLSRIQLASLFTESCSVPSCVLSQHIHVPPRYYLHVTSMYTFQCACVTSQCPIATYLCTIPHTIPLTHPSGPVYHLCVSASTHVYHPHIPMSQLNVPSNCTVPVYLCSIPVYQCTSQHSIPVYLCTILVYHYSIPVL